jgi:hypothetical protein
MNWAICKESRWAMSSCVPACPRYLFVTVSNRPFHSRVCRVTQNSVRQRMTVWRAIWSCAFPRSNVIMNYSSRCHYTETLLLRLRDHFKPRPISAGTLASLIDLGWSDNRIACYFGVKPVKVSALRGYYGLVDQAQDSWVWRIRRRNRLESEG